MIRPRTKFGNIKVEVDGLRFDSTWESLVYRDLKLRAYAREISDLRLQVPFELQPGFRDNRKKKHQPIIYLADFTYTEANGQKVAADAKGMMTREAAIKLKMFRFRFPEYRLDVVKKPKKGRR